MITVYGLATLLLPAGLEVAVFRCVFDGSDSERKDRRLRTLTTALFVGPISVGLVVGALLGLAPPVLDIDPVDLGGYVVAAALFVAATVAPLALLRARERFRSYAFLALGYAAGQLGLRVIFVVIADLGVHGWVLAELLATAATLLLSLFWQGGLLSLRRGSYEDLRAGLRLGLPLVPHYMAHWGLNLSDRLILAAFCSANLVGVYGIGYQIAFVAGMAVTELNRAFMPRYGEAVDSPSARARLGVHAQQQVLATIAITAGASLLGPQVVHLALPESYNGAAVYVPWVALGFTFLGFYFLPMNVLSIVTGRTNAIWLCTLGAASVNVIANLLLVPVVGPMAAAINTAVGYLVLLVAVSVVARRFNPDVKLGLRSVRGPAMSSITVAAAGSVLAVRSGQVGLIAALASLAAVLLVLGNAVRATREPTRRSTRDYER